MSSAQEIANSHAFSGNELIAHPEKNWLTNGGNTFNQRFSPLSQINRYNVADLKAKWTTKMGSGAEYKNGGQSQILHYDGTLFISNGMNDVFALDVESGDILWNHEGKVDPKSGNPIGWVSRGIAMGEGKIFSAQIDARLKAIDQVTGEVIWEVVTEDWKKGFSITGAPLYYDGLVVVGYSGGELGVRGRIKAFDAASGDLVWTFYTVPGPGEFGHDTWPQDTDAWRYGGAPVWQTPAYDPELDMIYFTTGNPGPDLHGGIRPGDNLFSVSMVALDAKTGEYRWHFQQVHHDIWDYDSPNPVVLFEAECNGEMRKGVVQVSKTGWAYILDRVTGEPLIGIEEKAVMQEIRQATAATQPYPIGDAIIPQAIDIIPEQTKVINGGQIFTPFWDEAIAIKPGTMGGANWPPSSYDPETNLLYVCASDRISTFVVQTELNQLGDNVVYMGGTFSQAPVDDRGIIAALDLTTNTIDWRREWREICFSGSVNTAGGLLFIGRADGRLTALDKRNGDTIWMFSLQGEIEEVSEAAPPQRGPGAAVLANTELVADLDNGSTIYDSACSACHGESGEGGMAVAQP